MILTVNGSPDEFAEECVVADLVEAGFGDRLVCGIAIAVNKAVVHRSSWEDHRLEPGDCVDIVTAVQGG
jgi:sulfur carrier protein